MNKESLRNKQRVSVDTQQRLTDLGLTRMQRDFIMYFIFLTNMNALQAVALAGYTHGVTEEDEDTKNRLIQLRYQTIANELLKNPKVVKGIKMIKDEMSEAMIVDKFWVLNKLKTLAERGSENIQLKATELLGKTLSMFTDVSVEKSVEDPASIAKSNFNERMKLAEFKKDGTNE